MTALAHYGKPKSLGSGGSMVARLKLKGIDGRAPPGVNSNRRFVFQSQDSAPDSRLTEKVPAS